MVDTSSRTVTDLEADQAYPSCSVESLYGGIYTDLSYCRSWNAPCLRLPLCGSNLALANAAQVTTFAASPQMWAIRTDRVVWTLHCLVRHAMHIRMRESRKPNTFTIQHLATFERAWGHIGHVLFIVTWSMCFGYRSISTHSIFDSPR